MNAQIMWEVCLLPQYYSRTVLFKYYSIFTVLFKNIKAETIIIAHTILFHKMNTGLLFSFNGKDIKHEWINFINSNFYDSHFKVIYKILKNKTFSSRFSIHTIFCMKDKRALKPRPVMREIPAIWTEFKYNQFVAFFKL